MIDYNELLEKVGTLSTTSRSRQADAEEFISDYQYVSIKVERADGKVTHYSIRKDRHFELYGPVVENRDYLRHAGYIRSETSDPDNTYGYSTDRSKLYDTPKQFENALKRISRMNIVTVR